VPMMPTQPSTRARTVGGCASLCRRAAVAIALIALALVSPGVAHAFQVETASTSGCHESITLEALDRIGWPGGARPPPLDETGRRIADDLPFSLPDDRRDLWTIALLIGVRYNDVGALDPFDLPALSQWHGDPDHQPEHCLRQADDDGEAGDQRALDACRDFVLDQVTQALAAGDGEEVDMDARVEVETHLLFRGKVKLDLPAYPFHLGRALHALQDSFTHAFRDPHSAEVLTVLNWVEGNLEGGSDPERDGHAHMMQLDRCGSGAGQERRTGWATDASADVLAALASADGGRDGRMDRVGAAFAAHTQREPGCTADNDWCDAQELTLSSGCSASGAENGPGWPLAALGLLALARAAAHRVRCRARRAAAVVLAAVLITPAAAGAQTEGADSKSDAQAKSDQDQAARQKAEKRAEGSENASLAREERVIDRLPDVVSETWGAALNVGAAIDRGAGSASLGVRWNPWRDLGFGLDAEYNPWVSVSGFDVAPGAASLYVPVIWRLKRFGTWELRTTAYAGASMILFDLVGVDSGTVGLFGGINPLGLALPLGGHTKLVVKPGDVAISAPQLRGIPYYYLQYRFTIGVEWYP
jgi:MYXO-CTERM domain-containing protein